MPASKTPRSAPPGKQAWPSRKSSTVSTVPPKREKKLRSNELFTLTVPPPLELAIDRPCTKEAVNDAIITYRFQRHPVHADLLHQRLRFRRCRHPHTRWRRAGLAKPAHTHGHFPSRWS